MDDALHSHVLFLAVSLSLSCLECRRAQEIEPGYCEPTYWIGVTLLNMKQAELGLAKVRESVRCKYVAGEALKTLNQVYLVLHEAQPGSYTPLLVSVAGWFEGYTDIEDSCKSSMIEEGKRHGAHREGEA